MSGAHEPSQGVDGKVSGTARDPESQEDDLFIEVNDLRHPPQERVSFVPWRRQSVQVPRPVVDVALAGILISLLLVATPIGSALVAFAAHPTPASTGGRVIAPAAKSAQLTPLPYPTPTLNVPAVGPVSANCPPETPPVDFSSGETVPGVGGSDVWFIASDRNGKHDDVELPPGNYTLAGWPVPVMVYIKHGFTQTITLTGHDLLTGYNLWLSLDATSPGSIAETAPLATINPGQDLAHSIDAQWDIWSGVLYLPGAGCYIVQANWPGNGWIIDFAAGR